MSNRTWGLLGIVGGAAIVVRRLIFDGWAGPGGSVGLLLGIVMMVLGIYIARRGPPSPVGETSADSPDRDAQQQSGPPDTPA